MKDNERKKLWEQKGRTFEIYSVNSNFTSFWCKLHHSIDWWAPYAHACCCCWFFFLPSVFGHAWKVISGTKTKSKNHSLTWVVLKKQPYRFVWTGSSLFIFKSDQMNSNWIDSLKQTVSCGWKKKLHSEWIVYRGIDTIPSFSLGWRFVSMVVSKRPWQFQ